ncbi:hypothetical protein CPter91_1359 [Collimonas pratensis]|uniref:Uncharacterized protein n=1 Tax=Collimonas pratensis TaxID=279113 RepID=A0A127Q0Y8_9BURK|nr:hypothetical protein CPter91_1359 [Collimonas pratensis]
MQLHPASIPLPGQAVRPALLFIDVQMRLPIGAPCCFFATPILIEMPLAGDFPAVRK